VEDRVYVVLILDEIWELEDLFVFAHAVERHCIILRVLGGGRLLALFKLSLEMNVHRVVLHCLLLQLFLLLLNLLLHPLLVSRELG